MEQNITPNTFALQVDNGNIPYLVEAAKWAKFLGILGFILCALMIICGLFAGSFFASLPEFNTSLNAMGAAGSIFITVWLVLIALLYFFPSLYLFNFASKMQTAIRNNDQVYLNSAFKNLKSCFKFWGILLIIMLCIYAIAITFAVIGGSMGFGR
jgi:uncharacterized protein DUF5362